MFYVSIPVVSQLNRLFLYEELIAFGINDVYYYSGYNHEVKNDTSTNRVMAHLAFEHKADAIVFALSRGTTVLLEPPIN